MQRHFTEQEMREVLARAEEIQLHSGSSPAGIDSEAIVAAAEEAGLSRDAVLQAMRERLKEPPEPPRVGQRLFAESADSKLYVAEVLEVGEGTVRVRFIKGGERTVALADTEPCTLLPGQKVGCSWPNWGWWPSTIISYDAEAGEVRASDGWGSIESFAITDIRLNSRRAEAQRGPMPRVRFFLVSLAAGVALGGTLGGLVTWLLMR